MRMLSVAEVAVTLERAREVALPGRATAECNAVWCELGEVLQSPPASEPRWRLRLVASEPRPAV
jgi:hypothetical protein